MTDEPDIFQEDGQEDLDPDRIPCQIEGAGDKHPTPPSRQIRPVIAPKRPVGGSKSAAAKGEPSNDVPIKEAKADVDPKQEPSQQIIKFFRELSGWDCAFWIKDAVLATIPEVMGDKANLDAQIQIPGPKGENLTLPFKLSLSDNLEGGLIFRGIIVPKENKA